MKNKVSPIIILLGGIIIGILVGVSSMYLDEYLKQPPEVIVPVYFRNLTITPSQPIDSMVCFKSSRELAIGQPRGISMRPFLDDHAYIILTDEFNESELRVGHIICSKENEEVVASTCHTIVYIGEDSRGWYAHTRGSYNNVTDPETIRADMVKSIVIGEITRSNAN